MRLLDGLVVAARPGAVTIQLTTGREEDVLVQRRFFYGEQVKVAFDYFKNQIRAILRIGEEFPDEYIIDPPEEVELPWEKE